MNGNFGKGLILLILVGHSGQSHAATQVFRCVDEAGKVEFRQGHCPAGEEQALSIESPRVGWIR